MPKTVRSNGRLKHKLSLKVAYLLPSNSLDANSRTISTRTAAQNAASVRTHPWISFFRHRYLASPARDDAPTKMANNAPRFSAPEHLPSSKRITAAKGAAYDSRRTGQMMIRTSVMRFNLLSADHPRILSFLWLIQAPSSQSAQSSEKTPPRATTLARHALQSSKNFHVSAPSNLRIRTDAIKAGSKLPR